MSYISGDVLYITDDRLNRTSTSSTTWRIVQEDGNLKFQHVSADGRSWTTKSTING